MKFTIEKSPAHTGGRDELQVWQDGKTSGPMRLGELIEQVLALLGVTQAHTCTMMTPQEWAARWRRPEQKAKELARGEPDTQDKPLDLVVVLDAAGNPVYCNAPCGMKVHVSVEREPREAPA